MKKVAIAAAVAGVFATSATAAELSTFIYQDYALQLNDAAGVSSMDLGDAGSNMVNFNYSDDLGNGLGLIGSFSMTARGNADGGGTTAATSGGGIANRNSFIGLTGDFGKITIGTHELKAELNMILRDYGWDANYQAGGDALAITGIGYAGSAGRSSFTARHNGAIEWTSNDMNGLTLNVGIIESNTAASASTDEQGTEINIGYNIGGIALTAGVGNHDDAGGTAGDTMDFSYVTATYDFGAATVSFGAASVDARDNSASQDYSQSGQHLSVMMPMANGKVIAQIVSQGNRDLNGASVANSGLSGYDIGYMHDASANTKLYVRYLSREQDANYAVASGGTASETETLQLGMRYVY
jgi:hypothetical protein